MVNKDEYMGWVGLGHSVDGFELCQVVENGPADNPGVRGAISEGNVLRPLERPGRHHSPGTSLFRQENITSGVRTNPTVSHAAWEECKKAY